MSVYRKQDKMLAIVLLAVNLSLLGVTLGAVYTGHDAPQTVTVIIVMWVAAFTAGSIAADFRAIARSRRRERAKQLSQAWD